MTLRNILFQTHLWVGLILGILFVLLGISGSVLMFRATPGIGQRVPDIRASTSGTPLPLEKIAAAARAGTTVSETDAVTIVLPRAEGMPAQVRFGDAGNRFRRGSVSPDMLVDPVSGKVLGSFTPGMTSFMRFFHDMHGQMFFGRAGRQFVGWLGVGMTFLGLSGLYLWWPRTKNWTNAFIVRREAKGLRFHRELHGAAGIWSLIVFLVVTFTGVATVFPQAVGSGLSLATGDAPRPAAPPRFGTVLAPTVEPIAGPSPIGADTAVALARQANPGIRAQSVTLAAGPDQAITVTMGEGRGTPVFVDPYRGSVIARQPARPALPGSTLSSVMRTLHSGDGYGPIYWAAVLVSGFLPALFVFTGWMMWLKKRRNRRTRQAG